MKYFAIEFSLNEKMLGKIEQVKEIEHHCNVWDNPNFIDRFSFQKIDNNPILSNAILYSTSKLTDLIKVNGVGFFTSIVISDKFKNIINNFNCYGIQFFPTYLIHKKTKINNYWQSHIYDFPFEFINFNDTDIFIKNTEKISVNFNERLSISNIIELHDKINSLEYPYSLFIKNVTFSNEMDLDFFFIRYFENGGSLGIVSERLKEEIENQDCTGIEFRPIELSLREWYDSSERKKLYGKI